MVVIKCGDGGLQKRDLNPAFPDSEVQVLPMCEAAAQGGI